MINLRDKWQLLDEGWARSVYSFVYKEDRDIRLSMKAKSEEDAWGKLENVIRANVTSQKI
jgi:hypothetical protein